MNKSFKKKEILNIINELFNNDSYGHVIRIKGYFKENDTWYNVNAFNLLTEINPISDGQDVIIVIGENMNNDKINELIERK